jgi:outer membrane protein assembly factor BamC
LTLSSIGEVVSGAMRVWQPREKDVELETEMLLQLMIFLGSERADSIAKIQSNLEERKTNLSVVLSETGYASLVFPFDKNESWELLGWALDELSIDIDDRDQLEGSYFINVTTNKGLFSKLLRTASNNKTYQLILKEDTSSQTKVIFVDLSEEDNQKTISYSAELFDQIASKF